MESLRPWESDVSSNPKVILITGASRGLGRALALAYAGPDCHLILTARSVEALISTETLCAQKGARITPMMLDLASPGSIEEFLTHLTRLDLPDLFLANAGLYSGTGPDGQLEPVEQQRSVLEANLVGTIQLTDAIARQMVEIRRGQIGLVSSLAALQPQTDSPTYSASKAGLSAYGMALGDFLAAREVDLSVIYPGHIETDQTAVHQGALPGLISADKAAQIIRTGLDRRRSRIIFPRSIHWLILASNLLPRWLQRRINAPFRYHVETNLAPGIGARGGSKGVKDEQP